jgi:hypothetical protein
MCVIDTGQTPTIFESSIGNCGSTNEPNKKYTFSFVSSTFGIIISLAYYAFYTLQGKNY